MGAKCCAESKQAGMPTEVPAEIKDLPAVDFSGIRDPVAKFEASLPFNRTLVAVLLKKTDDAEQECGEKGFVTLEVLSKHLDTPAWRDLGDPSSNLTKVLLSSAFKNSSKGQGDDQIDAVWLKVFGLIHCSGKPIDKTNAFYEILQDGGYDSHEQISAGDKDFPPVFTKICEFVTVDAFKLAVETGCADTPIYSSDEE